MIQPFVYACTRLWDQVKSELLLVLFLAVFGICVGLFGVYTYDRKAVLERGFFQGYTPLVWVIVALQTCSGLGVAFVIKYADNILKGFAAGLSILLSSFVSYFLLHDFTPSV